jgi:trans-aconitate 2-methyltransferase
MGSLSALAVGAGGPPLVSTLSMVRRMARADTWDPDQYHRFAAERRRPFDDLLGLVQPVPGGTVVDLGCGTGELTAELHRQLGASETIGIDSSTAMLEQAALQTAPGLRFEHGDLAGWAPREPVDVVFANASLQWVPDHPAVLTSLVAGLAPSGQIAFQVPANHDHPAHTVAAELGAELGLMPVGPAASVLAPETYATVLYELGLGVQHVRLQVYGFELPAASDVVEWTKGTLLTGYRAQLDGDTYNRFEADYRQRLKERLGDQRPYFYAFKRILAWARRRRTGASRCRAPAGR